MQRRLFYILLAIITWVGSGCCMSFEDGYCYDRATTERQPKHEPLAPAFWTYRDPDTGELKSRFTPTDNGGCKGCDGAGEIVSCRRAIACDDSEGYSAKDENGKVWEMDRDEHCCTESKGLEALEALQTLMNDAMLRWGGADSGIAETLTQHCPPKPKLGDYENGVGYHACAFDSGVAVREDDWGPIGFRVHYEKPLGEEVYRVTRLFFFCDLLDLRHYRELSKDASKADEEVRSLFESMDVLTGKDDAFGWI